MKSKSGAKQLLVASENTGSCSWKISLFASLLRCFIDVFHKHLEHICNYQKHKTCSGLHAVERVLSH